MNADVMWAHIDAARGGLADLLESLTPQQWGTPSLCDGWTVRDVAVHVTHAHAGFGRALKAAVRSGFRFNAMAYRAAVEDPSTPDEIVAALRAMVGSRRKAPGALPLLDVLVHTQDVAIPLGIDRRMPVDAGIDTAERLWAMRFPINTSRAFASVSLHATDCDLTLGEGRRVDGPVRDIVLALSPDGKPD